MPVVKVFNSIFATSLTLAGRPKGDKDRIALAVSADRALDKASVFELVEDFGYDLFDTGTIADSWKQQPGSTIYCRDISLDEVKNVLLLWERIGPKCATPSPANTGLTKRRWRLIFRPGWRLSRIVNLYFVLRVASNADSCDIPSWFCR